MAQPNHPPQPPQLLRVRAQAQFDGPPELIYTPFLVSIFNVSTGVPSAWGIVQTGPNGKIDPSFLPPIPSGLELLTNGVLNVNQSVLNLQQGTNIVISNDAFGTTTISASGTFSTAFSNITTGVNLTATMTVGTGATMTYQGTGVLNANEIGTINVSGNLPTHPGMILVSQPGNTAAVWVDPQVMGLYPDGSSIASPPPYAPPTTIQPVYTGGKGQDGLLHGFLTTPSGVLIVESADEAEAANVLTFAASTGLTPIFVTTRRPVLSIQPQAGSNAYTFLLRKLRAVGSGNLGYFELVLNGTLTGAAFTSVDPNSQVNFDIAATSISGGRVVDAGYLNFGAQQPEYTLHFGFTGGNPDTLTLVLTKMGISAIPVSGSFRWTEEAQPL